MSADHPPQQDFALYVMGALDPQDLARLEQHVRGCAPCAAMLADEARFEDKLQELIPRLADASAARLPRPSLPVPRIANSERRQLAVPALVMLAAAVALVAGIGRLRTTPRGSEGADPTSVITLIESANGPFSEETTELQGASYSIQVAAGALCRMPEICSAVLLDSDDPGTCSAPSEVESKGEAPFTPIVAVCNNPE